MKWYGGKYYLAQRIIRLFPPHHIYLEPFGGAASVLLNKEPAKVEIYNDLDLRITRLFRVLRNQGDAFLRKVRLIQYSQIEFRSAVQYPKQAREMDKAVCDFVRWRQSFSGRGTSWSYTKTRSRGGMAGDVHAWWTAIDSLPEIIQRLRRVQIICQPAIEAIKRFDHDDALIYCDPPYVQSTRTSKQVYQCEMTDNNHSQLAQVLHKCKAKVVLSGYLSDLYDELYNDWNRIDFNIANHASSAKKKPRSRECLWMNY